MYLGRLEIDSPASVSGITIHTVTLSLETNAAASNSQNSAARQKLCRLPQSVPSVLSRCSRAKAGDTADSARGARANPRLITPRRYQGCQNHVAMRPNARRKNASPMAVSKPLELP